MQGFGRRRMSLKPNEVRHLVAYQLGAAQAMARLAGGKVRHLKLHGALANMAAEDLNLAKAAYEGAFAVDPDIIVMVITATQQQAAVEELGCRWAGEIFADRAYNDDCTLVDRSKPGAVIHDPEVAAKRVVAMVRAGGIIAESGQVIPAAVDTICLHGDGATAVKIAKAVRQALLDEGIELAQFQGR